MFTNERELEYKVTDVINTPLFEDASDTLEDIQQSDNTLLVGSTLRTATSYGRTATVKAGEDIRPALNSLKSAGGGTLVLLAGTHSPTYDIVAGDNLNIIGEGVGVTKIDFGNAARQLKFGGTSSPRTTNVSLKNLTVTNTNMNNSSKGAVVFEYVDYVTVENVSSSNNSASVGIEIYDCTEVVLRNVVCNDNTVGIDVDGTTATPSGSSLTCYNVYCIGNSSSGFYIALGNPKYCKFFACRADENGSNGFIQTSISGVYMSFIECTAISNGSNGFSLSGQYIKLIGCNARANSGSNVVTTGNRNAIIACDFGGTDASLPEKETFVFACTDSAGTNKRVVEVAHNGSGGSVSSGSVIIHNSTTTGRSMTTTTVQGDDMVYGVVLQTVANGGNAEILLEGKTTVLKVDGTTAITVGDFLCTYSVAGIAAKATTGDMAFAIALEAYSTADSNGVIDALIIKPRKI